jgi:aspartyl protease family protein
VLNIRLAPDQAAEARTPASGGGWPAGDQAVISAGRGGQFFVEAMIDGSHVQLVADTGATLVALTAEDAQRIGIDHSELDFRYRHRTANGVARAAHVILGEIAIGPVTVNNVRASVSEPGLLHMSLLGMSFLSQLSSFHIRGDQLVLKQ